MGQFAAKKGGYKSHDYIPISHPLFSNVKIIATNCMLFQNYSIFVLSCKRINRQDIHWGVQQSTASRDRAGMLNIRPFDSCSEIK